MQVENGGAGGALYGIRVLDLTSVLFGPYCSQVLADYGADVVKIESPAGDSTRYTGPAHESGLSAIFLGTNRNKRSVVLDLKKPGAVDALLTLVDSADVLMHSMRPQKMERLGLGPAVLRARNPRLVYAGLYGFGEGGAYAGQPAYDDIIQGLCGIAGAVQQQSGTPGYAPSAIADKTCGLVAAHAILGALFQRERTGQGQQVEVPMFESMVSFMMVEHFYGSHLRPAPGQAAVPAATGQVGAGYPRVLAPWRKPYPTRDGFLCVMPYTDRHWQAFFKEAGRDADANDPRFLTIGERTRHIGALYQTLGEIVAQERTAFWLDFCRRLEIPAAPVNALSAIEDDPHLQSVGFFTEIAQGEHAYRFTRNPVTLSASEVPPKMPPALGAHTKEVLIEAGVSQPDLDTLFNTQAAQQA